MILWVCRRKEGFLSKQERTEDVSISVLGAGGVLEANEPDSSNVAVYIDGAE